MEKTPSFEDKITIEDREKNKQEISRVVSLTGNENITTVGENKDKSPLIKIDHQNGTIKLSEDFVLPEEYAKTTNGDYEFKITKITLTNKNISRVRIMTDTKEKLEIVASPSKIEVIKNKEIIASVPANENNNMNLTWAKNFTSLLTNNKISLTKFGFPAKYVSAIESLDTDNRQDVKILPELEFKSGSKTGIMKCMQIGTKLYVANNSSMIALEKITYTQNPWNFIIDIMNDNGAYKIAPIDNEKTEDFVSQLLENGYLTPKNEKTNLDELEKSHESISTDKPFPGLKDERAKIAKVTKPVGGDDVTSSAATVEPETTSTTTEPTQTEQEKKIEEEQKQSQDLQEPTQKEKEIDANVNDKAKKEKVPENKPKASTKFGSTLLGGLFVLTGIILLLMAIFAGPAAATTLLFLGGIMVTTPMILNVADKDGKTLFMIIVDDLKEKRTLRRRKILAKNFAEQGIDVSKDEEAQKALDNVDNEYAEYKKAKKSRKQNNFFDYIKQKQNNASKKLQQVIEEESQSEETTTKNQSENLSQNVYKDENDEVKIEIPEQTKPSESVLSDELAAALATCSVGTAGTSYEIDLRKGNLSEEEIKVVQATKIEPETQITQSIKAQVSGEEVYVLKGKVGEKSLTVKGTREQLADLKSAKNSHHSYPPQEM